MSFKKDGRATSFGLVAAPKEQVAKPVEVVKEEPEQKKEQK